MNSKILNKIMKRNFNSDLEKLLEQKNYQEEAKNLLLGALYKIEAWYDEYHKVKVDIETKEEYINLLFSAIVNECDELEIVKMMQRGREAEIESSFVIKSENKKIISSPIDQMVIYALFKISNQVDIVKTKNEVKNKSLSNLLNRGRNLELIEAIRDFNGYSWVPENLDSESIYTNIVYQNLRMLVGNSQLVKLTNKQHSMTNNYDEMMKKIEADYGKYNAKELETRLSNVALLMFAIQEKEAAMEILKQKELYEKEFEKMQDTTKYLKDVITKKAKNLSAIEKLKKMLEDDKCLELEYARRNRVLKGAEKIFSKRILR